MIVHCFTKPVFDVMKRMSIPLYIVGCSIGTYAPLRGMLAMHDYKNVPITERDKQKSVTIIGAGPAGLLTAYRLKQAGINVCVIEARPRIGGRLFSYPQSTIEFGAWSLGDGGNIALIQALASELGLELNVGRMPFPAFSLKDGHIVDVAAHFKEFVGEDLEKVRMSLEAIIDASDTIQDVLDIFFQEQPALKHFCQSLSLVYHGSPASELSAKFYKEAIVELCLGGVSDVYTHEATFIPLYRIKGGNDLLVKRLAEYLNGALELNKPLKGLCRGNEQKIRLLFADGTCQESDTVVLALPVSAYHALEIEEGLIPSEQLEGIKQTRPGIISKIFLPGKGSKHPEGFFVADNFSGGISEDESYLTMHWGRPLDMAACKEAIEMLARAINWPVPTSFIKVSDEHTQPYPRDAALIVDWPHATYTGGSYCAFSPGQNDLLGTEDIDGMRVSRLFKPAGTLYFVGEAASVQAVSGSVGAAFESAELVAGLIKCRLKVVETDLSNNK